MPSLRTLLYSVVALTAVACSSRVLDAQTSDAPGTANSNVTDLLKTIDRLIEQNHRLEEQNRLLIDQINLLRKVLAAQSAPSTALDPSRTRTTKAAMTGEASPPPAAPASAAPQAAPGGQNPPSHPPAAAPPQNPDEGAGGEPARASQDTAATPASGDDKSFLPEASGGLPNIFGEFNPGRGFVVGRGRYGELDFSGYMVSRFLDQTPGQQTATDHLGRPITVTPRVDFQFHRVMLFSQGWLFDPKFQFLTFVWTVQDTNQVAVGGALTYDFNKYINLGLGWNAYPGTQSLQGSHPYWLSYDRVMADEFFRPYFSQGLFAQGNLLRTLQYRWLVGNNLSNLDIPAVKLNRDLSGGFAITWFPTTGEFGPRGAFGDYEWHERLATRFNFAYTFSPENRQAPIGTGSGNTTGTGSENSANIAESITGTTPSENTTIRLADSLNVFDTGALANGVTVQKLHYQLFTSAAAMKYHGFFLQAEGYDRKLDHFEADGPLPVSVVRNTGFYVQASQMIVPKRFELYTATSYIFGQYARHPHEFIGGANYYPWNTRNLRLNLQLIGVSHSPVSSTFGFYIGQLTGQIFSVGFTALY